MISEIPAIAVLSAPLHYRAYSETLGSLVCGPHLLWAAKHLSRNEFLDLPLELVLPLLLYVGQILASLSIPIRVKGSPRPHWNLIHPLLEHSQGWVLEHFLQLAIPIDRGWKLPKARIDLLRHSYLPQEAQLLLAL